MTVPEREDIALKIVEGIAGLTAPEYERLKQLAQKEAPDLIVKYPRLISLMDEIRQS